jgi:hypothetical protein
MGKAHTSNSQYTNQIMNLQQRNITLNSSPSNKSRKFLKFKMN